MKVSVIIPVYNTARFVESAIESALRQMEVAEVVVVDDGSTDNSLEIVRAIAERDSRIKVYCHPDGKNLGSGPTRNLGVEKSREEFIAFLDSDDYWIENRFKKTRELFEKHPDAEGVYEARAAENWNGDPASNDLSMIRGNPAPEDLFYNMRPFGKGGIITLIGLTVRRGVFAKAGYFSPLLRLAQDTHWVAKLSLTCRLYSGDELRPVAYRRFHNHNATRNVELHKKMRDLMCWLLLEWAVKQKVDPKAQRVILQSLLRYHFENNVLSQRNKLLKKKNDITLLIKLWRLDRRLYNFKELRYFRNLVLRVPTSKRINFYE